jgi:DNA-binding XRE family transcriptional regulator
MATIEYTQDPGRLESFGTYLRECRKRFPAQATALGSYRRLPDRIGRSVTQEEVAEAIGISRAWYATLESGAARSSSRRLLNQIAMVFSLTSEDRRVLLHLSFPELKIPA